MAKLTLSADSRTIERAKALAAAEGTSVSAMFERFVNLISQRSDTTTRTGQLARKATGLVRLPKGVSDRELIEDAIIDRHGLK